MAKRHLPLYFFCALALVFTANTSWARHIIGGSIVYEYLGKGSAPNTNRYRFTMTIYRDCLGGGAPYDNPAEIGIYKGKYLGPNILITSFPVNHGLVKSLDPPEIQCIQNKPNVCVEEATYVFEQELEVINESYIIEYQRCCRNNTISNIINPGDIGATYMVELTPEAQKANNSSPVFKNFPPIVICNGFPIDFDHVATDKDGDLLLYSFCAPFQGGGNITSFPASNSCAGVIPIPPCNPPFLEVPYTSPTYSPGVPMGGDPVVQINTVNGFISGSPNKVGQFVVGVCVEEYRNGILLSTMRREFQFNVADCTPTLIADIAGEKIGPRKFSITSCGQKKVKITNKSRDKNDVKKWVWSFNMNNGTTYRDTTTDKTKKWDLDITFPDTGLYQGKLVLNPGDVCKDSTNIFVRIFPSVQANFTYAYDTCVAGPVIFTDSSKGEAGITKWNWAFGVPGGSSTKQNPSYLYPVPGNHPVTLTVTDKNKCTDDTTQTIKWYPAPPTIILDPDKFLGCIPAEIFFNNLSKPIDETYKIEWDFGDGSKAQNIISPTHLYDKPGLYTIKIAITSPIGCYIADTFPNYIRVEPSPTANFTCFPDSLLSNFNNTVEFKDLSLNTNRWNWTFDKYGYTTEQNPTFTFPDTGQVKIRLIVTHPQGCKDSMTKVLDIRPEIRWYMPNAFTPNGDGTNDGFLGKGFLRGVNDFQMLIWNRWGELVFETNDPDEEWNGRAQGTGGMSPAGVYVYVVKFTAPRGQPYEIKGYATLVR